MYVKKLILLATFICLAFAFSLSAYAMPKEDEPGFFDTFQISQDDLQKDASEDNVGLYIVSKDGVSVLQSEDSDINDYSVFNLNKGFSKPSIVTFADTKFFSGKGDNKTEVGIMVFNLKDNKLVTTFDTIQTIGASGVYNASISLKTGYNNVIFIVKKDNLMLYRLFKVFVKEEDTKDKLENIQINFIPDNGTDQKPSGLPFNIYNFPGTTSK